MQSQRVKMQVLECHRHGRCNAHKNEIRLNTMFNHGSEAHGCIFVRKISKTHNGYLKCANHGYTSKPHNHSSYGFYDIKNRKLSTHAIYLIIAQKQVKNSKNLALFSCNIPTLIPIPTLISYIVLNICIQWHSLKEIKSKGNEKSPLNM